MNTNTVTLTCKGGTTRTLVRDPETLLWDCVEAPFDQGRRHLRDAKLKAKNAVRKSLGIPAIGMKQLGSRGRA